MRVDTVDGLVTLFYDGSKELFNSDLNYEWWCDQNDWDSSNLSDICEKYIKERLSWQQVIVMEGVAEIPEYTFYRCYNIERVIFADTVIEIERWAFSECNNLKFIKLSITLEYIARRAFHGCDLSSVFIPPRCRYIGEEAFARNSNLTIVNVPQNTELERDVIDDSKLHESCPGPNLLNAWLKNINNGNQYALHRLCSSFEPTLDMILDTVQEMGGPKAFKIENSIGIMPSRYLEENPYTVITEKEIIEKYILKMMGEN